MEKKKVVPVWLSVVLTVLFLAGIVFYGMQMGSAAEMGLVFLFINIVSVLAIVFALIYCIGGYKKSGAVFFKLFCCVNALVVLIDLLIMVMTFGGTFGDGLLIFLALIELVVFCIFSIKPNMGRKKSLILAGVLIFALAMETIWSGITDTTYVANACAGFVVTVVFFIMVYAKYQDKAARGTK